MAGKQAYSMCLRGDISLLISILKAGIFGMATIKPRKICPGVPVFSRYFLALYK